MVASACDSVTRVYMRYITYFELARDCMASVDMYCGSNMFLSSFYDMLVMLSAKSRMSRHSGPDPYPRLVRERFGDFWA